MSFFKQGEWELFGPLYLATFMWTVFPNMFALSMLFFLARGFTAAEAGIGFSLMFLFSMLAEIPTGAFADIFGNRKSVQLSFFLSGIITAYIFFVTEPWMMWVAYSALGISLAFFSGAFESLPYVIAKAAKRGDLVKEYYRKYFFIMNFGISAGYFATLAFLLLVGSSTTYLFLGQSHQGLDFLWFTGALGSFIAFLLLFRVKEPSVKRKDLKFVKDMIQIYKKSLQGIKHATLHPVINKLLMVGLFSSIAYALFSDVVYQPFLIDLGFKAESMAFIIAVAFLGGAFFSLIPKHLEKRFDTEKKYLQAMTILRVVLLISLFFLVGPIFSLIFFFIYYNYASFIVPVIGPFRQFFYKKELRTTISSVDSLVGSIALVIFLPIAGYLVDKIGPKYTVIFAVIPYLLELLFLSLIKQKERLVH